MLRESGLLLDRRAGKWIHYRLSPHIPAWAAAVIEQAYLSQRDHIVLLARGNQPMAFIDNTLVKNFLENSGAEGLPLILLDGELVMAGRYPTRADLARWCKLPLEITGGVGKTSISCASAITLADAGKRVLLVSTDPASNVGQVFNQPIGNQITAIATVPGLSALEIDPQAAAQLYRSRIVDPVKGLLPEAV
uniref:HTH arsR-type domain-containing protein n=1 Tax=Anopheles maculatus TaxID=74869 RepID=A0A182SH65_9DIPT